MFNTFIQLLILLLFFFCIYVTPNGAVLLISLYSSHSMTIKAFYSILFYSILFYSILFYSILFHSNQPQYVRTQNCVSDMVARSPTGNGYGAVPFHLVDCRLLLQLPLLSPAEVFRRVCNCWSHHRGGRQRVQRTDTGLCRLVPAEPPPDHYPVQTVTGYCSGKIAALHVGDWNLNPDLPPLHERYYLQ